ncbi:hypothetical protein LINPERPRIM_LOCUS5193 [Linum perenne]
MVLLCFVLNLYSLSPSSQADLKQGLLQLANYYAISSSQRGKPHCLGDRIGLCYVIDDRSSSSVELKVAYSPRGEFCLRDFHHAVNDLPTDSFLPEIGDSDTICSCVDMKLSSILNDQALYSWGGRDVKRNLIFLSSYFPRTIDDAGKKLLTDASYHGVSVEFVFIEQSSSHLSYMMENNSCFVGSLSDLHNCSFRSYLPGSRMFHGLTKRWLHDLRSEMEEPLLARFNFGESLIGNLNHVLCCLSSSFYKIVDDFGTCQTCRCHDAQLHQVAEGRVETFSFPVSANILGASDVISNSVRVAEKIPMKPEYVSLPIEFTIIQRTNLSSLSEGVIIGSPYIVTPADYHKIGISSSEEDLPELNAQGKLKGCDLVAFQGICHALHSTDQGLICSSYYNLKTMMAATFNCFYILQPSENGPMLLRRLLGSEEALPLPDLNQVASASITQDIQSSIQAVLLKIESSDYNPLLHERGFHQKLNSLINESLQLGWIPPKLVEGAPQLSSINQADSSEVIGLSDGEIEAIILEEENQKTSVIGREDEKSRASISEEWEQLVVLEDPKKHSSPTCSISKPKMKEAGAGAGGIRQLDAKTSRILERLELPRQLKAKPKNTSPSPSPSVSGSSSISETTMLTKRPLLPFRPIQATEQLSTSTQLIKPVFQRPKKKLR